MMGAAGTQLTQVLLARGGITEVRGREAEKMEEKMEFIDTSGPIVSLRRLLTSQIFYFYINTNISLCVHSHTVAHISMKDKWP